MFNKALEIGISAAGPVVGSLVLPQYGHQLVGGLGMIAATGAVSACFAIAINLLINLPLLCAYGGNGELMQKDLEKFFKAHPGIAFLAILAEIGKGFAGMYLASLVMGQAFLPLLVCSLVGTIILAAGCGLLLGCVAACLPKQEQGLTTNVEQFLFNNNFS